MDDGWKDFKNTYLTGLLACTEKQGERHHAVKNQQENLKFKKCLCTIHSTETKKKSTEFHR